MSGGSLLGCTRCELHRTCRQPVQGDGPRPAPVMVIGEAPGYEEDINGVPFKGKAGMDLNFYLYEHAGIRRNKVYVTNVIKCRPPDNVDPTEFQIARCRKWLDAELETVQPEVIITVGRFAARIFKPDINMEAEHGIPFETTQGDRRIIVHPCYHTALGLHDIRKTTAIIEDFKRVGDTLRELERGRPVSCPLNRDEYPNPRYRVITGGITERLYNHVLQGDHLYIGLDTEWCTNGELWSVQISTRAGEGGVIFPDNETAMRDLKGLFAKENVTVIVHNANADIPQIINAGLGMPRNFHDSMIAADIIQKEPKGLKALAKRFAGMHMDDYMSIISDAQREMSINYLKGLQKLEHLPVPPARLVWEYDNKIGEMRPRTKRPWSVKRRVDRILKDIEDGKDVDPLKRWNNIKENEGRREVEANLSPMPRADLRHADPERALHYAARDADATLRVWPYLADMLSEYDLWDAYNTDMGALRLVLQMEHYGMRVNVEHYVRLESEFDKKMVEARDRLKEEIGYPVNPASPTQVADLVYKRLEMPQPRQAKDYNSTNSKHLKPLRKLHPAIGHILTFREFKKLNSSFCKPIVASALGSHEEDRVRSSLRVSGADTGRMTSRRPNLMNQPSRSDIGRMIREGFIAPEGMVLAHSDFGKMDFTIMAHCSQDERMCKIMWDFWNESDPEKRADKDLHAITAQMLFGVKPSEQDKYAHRLPAKTVGFGVAFGLSPMGLQDLLLSTAAGLDPEKDAKAIQDLKKYEDLQLCENLIAEWFKGFHGVRSFFDDVIEETRRRGYARDCFGRVRFIGAINSIHNNVRTEAERQACNAVIQGGTAGAIKKAMANMVDVCEDFRMLGHHVEPWMQIHDALLFAVDKECAVEFAQMFRITMSSCITLRVPVIADVEIGEDWAGLTDNEEKWKPMLLMNEGDESDLDEQDEED